MQLKSLGDITSDYQYIYLSPHFDDVVYSCAGTIGKQVQLGQHPLVVTIFAGIPPAELKLSLLALKFHARMGFDQFAAHIVKYRGVGRVAIQLRQFIAKKQDAGDVIRTRRNEDARAVTYLETDYLWFDYLEAIYRGTSATYDRRSPLLGSGVNPADSWIEKQLAQELVKLRERLPDAVWYAPLGVGRHVDHQIVTSAAEALIYSGAKVKFYEDFPYVVKEDALAQRLKELAWALTPELNDVTGTLHLRQTAAEMYGSQTNMNFDRLAKMYGSQTKKSFDSREALYKSISDYTLSLHPENAGHLERYWVPGKSSGEK